MARITRAEINPQDVRIRHDVDDGKVQAIAESMEGEGWQGRPAVIYQDLDGRLHNITGCHRLCAAMQADIDALVILIVAEDEDEVDVLEFAAANDDFDAGAAVGRIDHEVGELVERG